MKVTYEGIEVEYGEAENNWQFELRGRHRIAPSLAKAKEAIDKEPAEKKQNKFHPFDVYFFSYNDKQILTLTSFAEKQSMWKTEAEAWLTDKKTGKRSKEYLSRLYMITSANDSALARIAQLEKQRKNITAEIDKEWKAMEHPVPPQQEKS